MHDRGLAAIAVVLSGVAGYVDVIGWLLFSQVYAANMSGNALGLFAGELLYEVARQRGRPSSVAWTLGLEAVAISGVLVLPPGGYYLPTGLLALGMGLQNVTLVRVGASSVYTTHVTGNLTRLAREAAHWVVRGLPRARRRVALMTAMLAAYTAGALLGTWGVGSWERWAVMPAVLALAALVVVDVVEPIGGHERTLNPMF